MGPEAIKSFGLQPWASALGLIVGSPKSGNLSSVYIFDAVAHKLAFEEGFADRTPLLGYAIAHELGHILLRQNNHSHTGIMQARWDHKALQKAFACVLGFVCNEPARIRAEVEMRLQNPGNKLLTPPVSIASTVLGGIIDADPAAPGQIIGMAGKSYFQSGCYFREVS
jgi:hypothetical protein